MQLPSLAIWFIILIYIAHPRQTFVQNFTPPDFHAKTFVTGGTNLTSVSCSTRISDLNIKRAERNLAMCQVGRGWGRGQATAAEQEQQCRQKSCWRFNRLSSCNHYCKGFHGLETWVQTLPVPNRAWDRPCLKDSNHPFVAVGILTLFLETFFVIIFAE